MDLLCGGGHLRTFVIWIEQDLPFQERAENIEQPIGDTAQCPSMAVAAAAQLGIALAADRIMLDGHAGPMVDGVLQPRVAGMASHHDAALAAAAGYWGHARQYPQHVVISPPQRLAGLGEQRGDVDPSEPWTGTQDRDVALLADLPRRALRSGLDGGAELVQPALSFLDLLIDEPQTCCDGADMGGCGFGCPRRHPERRPAQDTQDLCRIQATNAIVLEDACDRLLADPRRPRWSRHLLPYIEEPFGRQVIAQFAGLRVVSPQLAAHPVGQAILLLLELIVDARPFPQLDHQRIVDREAAEGVLIGAQRTGQHLGIAAVVPGAGNAEAITKAVELPGVDGKDLKAALQQRLDHGAVRRLDRHCDLRRASCGLLHQPRAHLRQLGAAMRDVALGDALALGIKQADAVLRARPIDTDKPMNLVTHPFTSNRL